MKKFCFLLMSIFLLASCSSDNEIVRMETISVYVDSLDWYYSNEPNNNYFCAYVDQLPELTEHVFDYGAVKAYLVSDRLDYRRARKNILPYVFHKEYFAVDNSWESFTETIDFTYGIGWAEFYFTRSDFYYELDESINPPSMEFDIVITYPHKE